MCRKGKRGFNNIVTPTEEATARKNSDTRVLTGFITGLIIFASIYIGGYVFALVVGIFVFFALKEYVKILQCKGFQPSFRISFFIAFLLFLVSVAHRNDLFPLIIFFGVTLSFCAVLFKLRQPYIANVATTVFGFILCWLPTHVYLIRGLGSPGKGFLTLCNHNEGLGFLVMMFFTILATDICAFFVGRKFGKHKLSPEVSPKKTVEGAVGGSVAAILIAMFFGYVLGMTLWQSVLGGVLITFFAQIGDLSESLIKRDAGVKDSGNSLPGHGGYLDRADSYILSAPVAYYFFKCIVMGDWTFLDTIQKALSNVGFM